MTGFRKALPQLGGDFFLTDGGIETTLIFLVVEQIAAACAPLFAGGSRPTQR